MEFVIFVQRSALKNHALGGLKTMPQSRSKYQFYQEASLSQKLAHKDNIYSKLAGSDTQLSDSIGTLLVLAEFGMIDKDDPNIQLILAMLDVLRKSKFATSEKVNEITKMGLQMPKAEDEFFKSEE
jgi:hypothetical protein